MGEKNILIAQIGKGNYGKTTYAEVIRENEELKAGVEYEDVNYIFEAIMKKNGRMDVLILAGTKSSAWREMCEKYSDETDNLDFLDGSEINVEDKDIKKSVETFLSAKLSTDERELKVKLVILKFGLDEDEFQDNFEALQNGITSEIEKNGEQQDTNEVVNIHFDISNGFRSLPVYIYAFVNYMTRVEEREFRLFMYYGMLDLI